MQKIHLTPKSKNAKTGPIPVSMSSDVTCPPSCPFNSGGGCYAATGPIALHWKKVSSGDRGMNFADFCDTIASLPDGQLWRHNQAGDLCGAGDTLDVPALDKLSEANKMQGQSLRLTDILRAQIDILLDAIGRMKK